MKTSRPTYYHSLLLDKYDTAMQKLRYIHDNPVRHGFVTHPEDWLYSSAIDYAGGKGLLNAYTSIFDAVNLEFCV